MSRTIVDVALSSPLVVSVPMADHAEKRREDDLREQGFDFRRPTWDRVWRRTEFEAMMRGTRVPRAARG